MRVSEAKTVYRAFLAIDDDHNGSISVNELLELLEIEHRTVRFAHRIFCAFDDDGSFRLTYWEFLVATWNLCSLDHAGLIEFVFYLYNLETDIEGLTKADLKRLAGEVLGATETERLVRSMNTIRPNTILRIGEFTTFVKNNPAILFPAFALQRELIDNVGGQRFWRTMAARRVKMNSRMAHWKTAYEVLKERIIRRRSSMGLSTTSSVGMAHHMDNTPKGGEKAPVHRISVDKWEGKEPQSFSSAIHMLDEQPSTPANERMRRQLQLAMDAKDDSLVFAEREESTRETLRRKGSVRVAMDSVNKRTPWGRRAARAQRRRARRTREEVRKRAAAANRALPKEDSTRSMTAEEQRAEMEKAAQKKGRGSGAGALGVGQAAIERAAGVGGPPTRAGTGSGGAPPYPGDKPVPAHMSAGATGSGEGSRVRSQGKVRKIHVRKSEAHKYLDKPPEGAVVVE